MLFFVGCAPISLVYFKNLEITYSVFHWYVILLMESDRGNKNAH